MRHTFYSFIAVSVLALAGCAAAKKSDVWENYDVRHPVPGYAPDAVARQYDNAPIDNDAYYQAPGTPMDNDAYYTQPACGGIMDSPACGD